MRRSALLLALGLAAWAAAPGAQAQPGALPPLPPDTTASYYGASTSVVIRLDEYGFGLGTAARARLTDDLSLTIEAGLGSGKDAREQRFFVGVFGDSVTPFKRNYVLLAPLHFGVEQRLFRRAVEDNFRPYAVVAGGPVVALQWPYFDDADGDGINGEGEERLGALGGVSDVELRLGASGSAGLGAYFGRGRRTAQGLRFSILAHYFPAPVELLELREEVDNPSRELFVTPIVSYHFVRLLN